MRRNIGCHTDSNTERAVQKKVWQCCRQHTWLFASRIIVGTEINRVFFDIAHQLRGHFGHARFGITHRSSGITIHRSEVTLTLHQRIARREILRQFYHCFIH